MLFLNRMMVLGAPLCLLGFGAVFVDRVEPVAVDGLNDVRYQTDRNGVSSLSNVRRESSLVTAVNREALEMATGIQYREGDRFALAFEDGMEVRGIVCSVALSDVGRSMSVETGNGQVLVSDNGTRERVRIFTNGSSMVEEFVRQEGRGWRYDVKRVGDVMCGPSEMVWPVAFDDDHSYAGLTVLEDEAGEVRGDVSAMGIADDFQSKPGASHVIYCDFDGEVVQQPEWRNGKRIDAEPSTQTEEEIAETLRRVAEIYAPFDVNVTNVRSVYEATSSVNRVMCVCTPTNRINSEFSGAAIEDSFEDDVVCWNFSRGEPDRSAFTIAHEVGHTLGLQHDRRSGGASRYAGHASAAGFWSPIMGAGAINTRVAQWSKGDFANAAETQDDLAIISTIIPYAIDDHGDSNGSATAVTVGMESGSVNGLIETDSDRDVFRLEITDYSKIRIETGIAPGGTLDAWMRIYDSDGTLLANAADEASLKAFEERVWKPGIYFVWIEGGETGNPFASPPTGWTDYGSIGAYELRYEIDPLSRNEAVDNFTFIMDGGDSDWVAQTDVTHDGVDALVSGDIDNPAQAEISEFSMETTATSVSFWYKTSTTSGPSPRRFEFTVDGVYRRTASGENDWTFFSENLGTGLKTLRWAYVPYSSDVEGEDKVWVDQIVFNGEAGGYGDWAAVNGGSADGEGDEDSDGVVDLLEYGLAGTPGAREAQPLTVVDGESRSLSFRRDAGSQDLTYRVQVSDDLVVWRSVALSYEGGDFSGSDEVSVTETTSGGEDLVEVSIVDPGSEARFFRVMVTRN